MAETVSHYKPVESFLITDKNAPNQKIALVDVHQPGGIAIFSQGDTAQAMESSASFKRVYDTQWEAWFTGIRGRVRATIDFDTDGEASLSVNDQVLAFTCQDHGEDSVKTGTREEPVHTFSLAPLVLSEENKRILGGNGFDSKANAQEYTHRLRAAVSVLQFGQAQYFSHPYQYDRT